MSMRYDDAEEDAFNRGLGMGFAISFVVFVVAVAVFHYV